MSVTAHGTRPKPSRAAYYRAYRARKKAERLIAEVESGKRPENAAIPAKRIYTLPEDPIGALAEWATSKLRVPPGHKLGGQPMTLPLFGEAYLRDAWAHRESGLFVARKNGKSAICAVYLLGRLVGPIRANGWRGAVCSVNKEKAGELLRQMREIAAASGIGGLKFLRSPSPGRVESDSGTLDILSADKSAGHASGFDDVLVDELGLLEERDRALVNGLRTSTSARDGRFIAISILGDSPFPQEMIERRESADTSIHLYAADPEAAIDDENAWGDANPGLYCGIKSMDYMRSEARRVKLTPSDQGHFRAFDLNQPQAPDREMVLQASDWLDKCAGTALEMGPYVLGIDLGGSSSMTAAVAYWPETGAMRVMGAFADVPALLERGKRDGCGDRYVRMAQSGELVTYQGMVTPVDQFIKRIASALPERPIQVAADRYRKAEMIDAMSNAGVNWPVQWRGQGHSHTADGSRDIRAFQKLALTGRIHCGRSLMMESAIAESSIVRDAAGNPKLNRARANGRIDALQAGVLAAGLGERYMAMRDKSPSYAGLAG